MRSYLHKDTGEILTDAKTGQPKIFIRHFITSLRPGEADAKKLLNSKIRNLKSTNQMACVLGSQCRFKASGYDSERKIVAASTETFIPTEVGEIDHRITTRCRVVSGEIPVTTRAFDRSVKVIDILENDLHFSMPVDAFRVDHAADFRRDFIVGEGLVNRLDAVSALVDWKLELSLASIVHPV